MTTTTQYATGRRKYAVARAWLTPGSGQFTINARSLDSYFPRSTLRSAVQAPFEIAGIAGKYDVKASLLGGGSTGQAGALRHAISRALVALNPAFRESLKKEGFLTRDSRVKERKKYGQKGARKRFQYSKR